MSTFRARVSGAPVSRPNHCLFSKHLEWVEDYKRLAETTAELGFESLDLTVRDAGHVDPSPVEEDLPKACEAGLV